MTKEELLEEIDRERKWLDEAGYTTYNIDIVFSSLRKNIKALEQESNADLITLSKALITIVNEECTHYGFTKACEIAERVLGLEKDNWVIYDPREE